MIDMVTPHFDLSMLAFSAFMITGGALIATIVWIGKRAIKQSEDLAAKMELGFANVNASFTRINETLSAIERDIRGEIKDLDSRLSRIEGKLGQ